MNGDNAIADFKIFGESPVFLRCWWLSFRRIEIPKNGWGRTSKPGIWTNDPVQKIYMTVHRKIKNTIQSSNQKQEQKKAPAKYHGCFSVSFLDGAVYLGGMEWLENNWKPANHSNHQSYSTRKQFNQRHTFHWLVMLANSKSPAP